MDDRLGMSKAADVDILLPSDRNLPPGKNTQLRRGKEPHDFIPFPPKGCRALSPQSLHREKIYASSPGPCIFRETQVKYNHGYILV